jgi:hypothetical protein
MNLAQIADLIRLKGELTIEIYDVKGRRVRRMAIRNTITYNGFGAVIRLLAQDGVVLTDYQVDSLRAGSNATPPTRGDTALGTPAWTITLVAANRVQSIPTGELIIQAQIGPADAVGVTFREVGLFFTNGSMLSRQVHPEFVHLAGFTVSYTWRIGVTE